MPVRMVGGQSIRVWAGFGLAYASYGLGSLGWPMSPMGFAFLVLTDGRGWQLVVVVGCCWCALVDLEVLIAAGADWLVEG